MDFNNQKARKEIVQELSQLEKQRKTVIKETRKWVRKWNAEQREMVLWILEEEVRDDNLLLSTKKKLSLPKVTNTPSKVKTSPSKVNFKHEDGGGDWKALQSEEIETGEDDV